MQDNPSFPARLPIAIGAIATLLLVVGLGGWASLTTITGAIVGAGELVVESKRQVVNHPTGGVVKSIHVEDGDFVEAGQILFDLDDRTVLSELSIVEGQYFELQARSGRLKAERDAKFAPNFPAEFLEAEAADPSLAELRIGQETLFEARKKTMEQQLEQLAETRVRVGQQIEGAQAQIEALEEQIGLIQEEMEDQQSLLNKGLAQASKVLALRREHARLKGTTGELTAQIAQFQAQIGEIDIERIRMVSQQREQAIGELRDIEAQIFELAQRRLRLRDDLQQLQIKAPRAGVVHGKSVFALQSVVRAAEPLLYIVPKDSPLVIVTRVPPNHVDQVHAGQPAVLRFSAFNSRTTPEINGVVYRISADVFEVESTGERYFMAEIHPNPDELAQLEGLELVPGMPVESYISTDERTPISYLIKPFTDYFNKAFRES